MDAIAPSLVGTVFRIFGKEISVRAETPIGPRVLECYLRGRLFDPSGENQQLAVGDEVQLDPVEPLEGPGPFRGVLHGMLPRRTALIRQLGGRNPKLQVLAANVDQIVIVSALTEPPYKTGLIDRYVVIAHHAGIEPALCLNKVDLGDEAALERAEADLAVYSSLGYPSIRTSAKRGVGVEALRALLAGKRSVVVGHSGVGKSKLAGAVQTGLRLSSGEVDRHGKGRHTTTASTLFPLDDGGELVDTPGVRELSIRHIPRMELAGCFREFLPFLEECRFTSCSHIPEPHCGVKRALEEGGVSAARYESYQRLYLGLH